MRRLLKTTIMNYKNQLPLLKEFTPIITTEELLFNNIVKSVATLYWLSNNETVKQIVDRIFEEAETQLANEKII